MSAEPWGTVEVRLDAEEPSCAHCGAACQQSRDGLTQRCTWCNSVMERDPDVERVVDGKHMIVRTWSRRRIRANEAKRRCMTCNVACGQKYCATCINVRTERGLPV